MHFAAVHQSAAGDYPPEVLDVWSPPVDERRAAEFLAAIAGGEELFVIAELEAAIAGFGSIVPARRELRAVYVDPATARQGVGTALLNRLEALARQHGVASLAMDASLNAVPFYRARGYAVIEDAVHRLRSGVVMHCVRMSKALASSST